MPAKNPRVNVVLDGTLYQNVQFLAEMDGVSMSAKVRDLVREALDLHEDLCLADFAEEREGVLNESSTMTHEEVWS